MLAAAELSSDLRTGLDRAVSSCKAPQNNTGRRRHGYAPHRGRVHANSGGDAAGESGGRAAGPCWSPLGTSGCRAAYATPRSLETAGRLQHRDRRLDPPIGRGVVSRWTSTTAAARRMARGGVPPSAPSGHGNRPAQARGPVSLMSSSRSCGGIQSNDALSPATRSDRVRRGVVRRGRPGRLPARAHEVLRVRRVSTQRSAAGCTPRRCSGPRSACGSRRWRRLRSPSYAARPTRGGRGPGRGRRGRPTVYRAALRPVVHTPCCFAPVLMT
jgi:hypothetical protein